MLALVSALLTGADGLPTLPLWSLPGLKIIWWLSVAYVAAQLTLWLVRWSFRLRLQRPPPALLNTLVGGVIWLAVLSQMSIVEFGVSPSTTLATSGVLLAIVGFAVRSLVADIFCGITMAIERPFEIGDWVELTNGTAGQVQEMTWRAVKLLTRDNLKVIVPNTKLALEEIINYDQPTPFWRSSQRLTLHHDVPPETVDAVLKAAVQEVPASAAVPRAPEARIVSFDERGTEWELRFWLPEYASSAETGHALRKALQRHLRFAGLEIPRPREDVYLASLSEQNHADAQAREQWIDQIALFNALPSAERQSLLRAAPEARFEAGSIIVREGEAGASLYLIHRGTCDVLVDRDGLAERIGVMGAGAVFGELSLLTGTPRSATVRCATAVVVREVNKTLLEPLLQRHPDLARELATVLADRQLADQRRVEQNGATATPSERDGLITSLLQGVRSFFALAG